MENCIQWIQFQQYYPDYDTASIVLSEYGLDITQYEFAGSSLDRGDSLDIIELPLNKQGFIIADHMSPGHAIVFDRNGELVQLGPDGAVNLIHDGMQGWRKHLDDGPITKIVVQGNDGNLVARTRSGKAVFALGVQNAVDNIGLGDGKFSVTRNEQKTPFEAESRGGEGRASSVYNRVEPAPDPIDPPVSGSEILFEKGFEPSEFEGTTDYDTVVLVGENRDDFRIDQTANYVEVRPKNGGESLRLKNVEAIQFADGQIYTTADDWGLPLDGTVEALWNASSPDLRSAFEFLQSKYDDVEGKAESFATQALLPHSGTSSDLLNNTAETLASSNARLDNALNDVAALTDAAENVMLEVGKLFPDDPAKRQAYFDRMLNFAFDPTTQDQSTDFEPVTFEGKLGEVTDLLAQGTESLTAYVEGQANSIGSAVSSERVDRIWSAVTIGLLGVSAFSQGMALVGKKVASKPLQSTNWSQETSYKDVKDNLDFFVRDTSIGINSARLPNVGSAKFVETRVNASRFISDLPPKMQQALLNLSDADVSFRKELVDLGLVKPGDIADASFTKSVATRGHQRERFFSDIAELNQNTNSEVYTILRQGKNPRVKNKPIEVIYIPAMFTTATAEQLAAESNMFRQIMRSSYVRTAY